MNVRAMLMVLLAIAATLILLTILVRWLEPRMAFFPAAGEDMTPHDFNVPHRPLTIETRDGERLHGWMLGGENARPRILYFHGNGGNLSIWAPIVSAIAAHGYSLLVFDYRGYGLSTGQPTEQGLYRDVEAAVERFWHDGSVGVPVVYWGRSLGVSMASYAATIRKPNGLILEAGFSDARSLLRDSPVMGLLARLSSYRFGAAEFLKQLPQPVPALLLHGDDDHVVPIHHGRALYDTIREPKRFVAIRGGDHNDETPSDPATYWRAVAEFIESLGK